MATDIKDNGTPEIKASGEKIDTFKNYEEENNSDSEDENDDLVFQDMQLFLHAIGEPQLIEHFLKNRVTLGQLLEFDENDLINCGIELVGDRKKILNNTGQMHCEKWMPASIQDLTSKQLLSSPGYYITLNDINKHIEYIGVTFKYLRRRLQDKPDLLELGKDYVGVSKVASELEDLLKTSKATYQQLKSLNKEVIKHSSNPRMKSALHIDENFIRKAKMIRAIRPTLLITLALCVSYKILRIIS